MAPQKTMAVGQQQQAQQQTNLRAPQGDLASKSRKKKGKQPQNLASNGKQHIDDVQPKVDTSRDQTDRSVLNTKQIDVTKCNNQQAENASSSFKTVQIKEQPSQVPSKIDESSIPARKIYPSNIVQENIVLAKQISTEESDDIDAGIELDGSSNSGSSVKDMNEDQMKSASVSPIMAQSNLERSKTDHTIDPVPVERVTGSLCQDIEASSKKVGSIKKQQLAANQQVIDADEQQLQQKLQNKQRKPSLTTNLSGNSMVYSNTPAVSSQGAPKSPALCKICEQHVYQMERMMAEKSVYHKSCFRCYNCRIQLRIDNYSSHEGQVYCKAHHRQLFQPQVKLDSEDDVDIVAKSTCKVVDEYLLQRGRLNNLSFSFLQPKPEEIKKRQMIICENEPAELPKDVVRCDTKLDDGIDRLNLNLNNILEKFERGNSGEESQPSSAGINIEKPSFNLKKTVLAFENKTMSMNDSDEESKSVIKTERPVVKKLTNLNGFLNRQKSDDNDSSNNPTGPAKLLAVRRSESLMMRLKKYESRIAGEQVVDDESDEDENNNRNKKDDAIKRIEESIVPKKLSSLKSQWENGDISRRKSIDGFDESDGKSNSTSDNCNGNSPSVEKNEELIRVRQQLARKRSGGSSSIKNIYENAIKEAQQISTPKLISNDLSALNGLSTSEIQQQLLQNGSHQNQNSNKTSSPNKDHYQLSLGKKANKLRERFEQGLINNSLDDSDEDNDGDNERNMTKLDQIRQEKMEDLSIFTEGEIKAREARNMFQQIDRRLSAASNQGYTPVPNSRSLASINASMQAKLQSQRSSTSTKVAENGFGRLSNDQSPDNHKPIRLLNNVQT